MTASENNLTYQPLRPKPSPKNPETRIVVVGYTENCLHVLVSSATACGIGVVSFREANRKEGAKHGFTVIRD